MHSEIKYSKKSLREEGQEFEEQLESCGDADSKIPLRQFKIYLVNWGELSTFI